MPSFNFGFAAPGSSSGPFLDLTKNPNDLFNQFQNLGRNTDAAANVYAQLGNSLGAMFDQYGQGQRAAINQRFDVSRNNALGSLAKRGFSGSSLAPSTASASERDRSLSLGAFEDSLLGQRIGASQKVAEGIAGAHMGGADLSQRLREALLGLNSSQSVTGGSGGGGGGTKSDEGRYLGDSPHYDDAIRKLLGGGGGGASGGGGSGGGGSGGGGNPAVIDNPFGQQPNKPKELAPNQKKWAESVVVKLSDGKFVGCNGTFHDSLEAAAATCPLPPPEGEKPDSLPDVEQPVAPPSPDPLMPGGGGSFPGNIA